MFYLINNEDDRSKVEQLYEEYKYLMFSEANKILQDKTLAEDAVQQSFIKIINNLHKIGDNNCPRTRNFMVIICRNTAKTIYNKRSYLNKLEDMTEKIDDGSAVAGSNPLDIIIDKDSVSRITQAIEALDPIYRDVLLLKKAYEYSNYEIAELLDMPVETIKKRLFRARKTLSETLERVR